MKLKLLSKREESLVEKIVDAAITVHKVLGSGKRLGFLINFNVHRIRHNIHRNIL
jgi:nitrogen regulatory protein PII